MHSIGFDILNSSLPISSTSPAAQSNFGAQGVLVFSAQSGFDPALTPVTVAMVMGGVSGSGYVVAHSSKVITQNCMLGPMFFPAGQYVARTGATGSTIVGAYIGFIPTP